jgi:hypothetical protein
MARIPRIKVVAHKYKAFGEKVVEWTLHPSSRPHNVASLKKSTEGILEIPDRIKHVHFIESSLDTFTIKLPAVELAQESLERFKDPKEVYEIPKFYYDRIEENSVPNLDFLYSRIADYTIAQCM